MRSPRGVLKHIRRAGAAPPHPDGASDDAEEAAVPSPDEPDAAQDLFSALDMRDRVVIMLLCDQIASEEQVAEVWALWRQQYVGEPQEPLWRFLTLVPEIDRELVFAETARVYGIEEARIARLSALPLIVEMQQHLSAPLWESIVDLRLIPICEAEQQHSHRMRLVFATHDPTHPDVDPLLQQLNLDAYELRYAPELDVVDLLAEAFPEKYQALRDALEEERKLLASPASFEPEAPPGDAPGAHEQGKGEKEEQPEAMSTVSSLMACFEELLVQAVQDGAFGVCLVPEGAELKIYAQIGQEVIPWRVVKDIPPRALFVSIKSAIFPDGFSMQGKPQQVVITRWIDGARIRFRISIPPPGKIFDQEAVIILVLKRLRKKRDTRPRVKSGAGSGD
ncbi:MAG: hypothetical protein ACE10K_05140 [Rhodothermales bacterium]